MFHMFGEEPFWQVFPHAFASEFFQLFIALIGVGINCLTLADAIINFNVARRYNTETGARMIAAHLISWEAIRLLCQLGFVYIGVISVMYPPPPPETDVLVRFQIDAVRVVLIMTSTLLSAKSFLEFREREQIRELFNKVDHDRRRRNETVFVDRRHAED